jgi:hypothetical protein
MTYVDPLDNRANKRCAEMRPVNVLLEASDVEWLESEARAHGTTVSATLRRLFRRLREVA